MGNLVKSFEEAKTSNSPSVENIFEQLISVFRHVLVLAVDRLDYETLHLNWLPNLEKAAKAAVEPSLYIQELCHLFSLFMV